MVHCIYELREARTVGNQYLDKSYQHVSFSTFFCCRPSLLMASPSTVTLHGVGCLSRKREAERDSDRERESEREIRNGTVTVTDRYQERERTRTREAVSETKGVERGAVEGMTLSGRRIMSLKQFHKYSTRCLCLCACLSVSVCLHWADAKNS